MKRAHLTIVSLLLLASALSGFGAGAPLLHNSKHNLAVGGPSRLSSSSESDMCVFCHTPHQISGQAALWNHTLSSATYTPYSSSTMKAAVGQPTGDSRLCLSCHDGTVALGMVTSRKLAISTKGAGTITSGKSLLGTDLSDDHPVSFTYDAALASRNPQLKDPSVLNNKVRLDSAQQVQCTSCHDAHSDQYGKFLVQPNTASALCLTCHNPTFWKASSHSLSARTWNSSGKNPWPNTDQTTVAANGCENCHTPHNAGTHQRLLTFEKAEDNCLVCHNGHVAAKNLANEFNKPSVHPVLTTTALHDEAEDPVNFATRHSACADCHNPHAANETTALRPNASGALAGVSGVDAGGARVKYVTRQYELCFRCHADNMTKGPGGVPRQFTQSNTRLEFAPANASYHPVIASGKNAVVPSLKSPWTTSSVMYCTDCHNNDQGSAAGGTGPNGPHGSQYAPLLERNLVQVDFQPENAAAYALCYKCHNQTTLLANTFHSLHVRDQQTACTTCHDPHGVAAQGHLINFNTTYVKPVNGAITYNATSGTCTLTCHGTTHNASAISAASPSKLSRLRR
jgi:predicted CXXCH cytochrome family protein